MAYVHVAHDCLVGSHTILANAATLAGHVLVEEGATIGAFSGVHQFCRWERKLLSVAIRWSLGTRCLTLKRLDPGEAKIFGINTVGLERRNFSADSIAASNVLIDRFFSRTENYLKSLRKLVSKLPCCRKSRLSCDLSNIRARIIR